MSHVFARHTKGRLPTVMTGEGCYLIDTQGKRYLDACGGAAVSCLGHSDARVVEAIKTQLDRIPFAHTGFFTSEPAEELADLLVELAPEGIERVYFVSGGSEAIEAGIKLARQYFLEIGQPQRRNIIARWQSYHGNTLGALAAGGNRWRRGQFEPLLAGAMHHVSPCHGWRWRRADESDADYAARLTGEFEARIMELGPETVAAFIAEPVVGATMGAVPPVAGYFKGIREVCDRYGILLLLDEVMCGMGRTGTLFACEQDGIAPDMIAVAKGLGAGYQPIGALLVSGTIYDAIAAGSGFFQHGHTYIGHPAACAAGIAVLRAIEEDGLLANVRERGAETMTTLQNRFGQHPNVGDIRGRGLFIGLELVADRDSKAPFDPALGLNAKIKALAMAQGLMCYPGGGTIDGRQGDHILLAPPFIFSSSHIGEMAEKLETALTLGLQKMLAAQ